jgi:D-alanyl-D-alanine carboxypeptidase
MARLPGYGSQLRSNVVAVLLALICVGASDEQISPQVASAALKEVQTNAASSISVAVVLDDKLVASQTVGHADSETAFSVGSVSKMFTAVSIMQLVESGKVALDGDAATYLPQYPVLHGISVRQLLDHTSGLPDYLPVAFATATVTRKTTPDEIMSSTLARPRDFAPGSDWNYSNTGYVVLGQIVEHVSGLPLAQYEQEHIFDVAGMRRSFVAPPLGKDVAAPFAGDPGDWSWYYACGDIFSTAEDLARFDIALMRGQLLKTTTFAAMQQTVPFATLAPGVKDGLGVFVSTIGDVSVVGHHGGEPGYRADNEMVPARGFAVAIVGNGNYDTNPVVAQALQSYVGANLEAALPPSAYVDGAPAMTARLTQLLTDLGSGQDDRAQMQVLAAINVPGIVKQLHENGRPTALRYVNKFYTSAGILYNYQVLFAKHRAILTTVIDKSDKMASLAMVTVPAT